MKFNLLLASVTILLCPIFSFIVAFNSFFYTIPVKIENARLKLAHAIPAGDPITAANDTIEMLPVVTDKAVNNLSK